MLKELRTEQQKSWQGGNRVSVDAYLRRYPELAKDPDTLSDLILAEMLLREGIGEVARLDDYLQRYPQCASRLIQRYRADLVTAMPTSEPPTVEMKPGRDATIMASPPPNMDTIQLDVAGQLAAQEEAFQQGVPKIPGYQIISELGRGGMGVVYRAKQLSANRDVALKVVRNDVLDTLPLATRKSTLDRFRHEAHAAARLEHDNLVPVYDVGDNGSLRYYAMRFVDGTSLYDMLRNKAMSNQDAARYIEPIARGLHYAHEQGVLHRDLKPHNIIVETKSGRPMLTDFGLAKFLEQRDELTHAGDVMGTPSYMSPEQARDSGKVTALADVYSLGAALYHVLTSRPPFQAANVAETIRQVFEEDPVPPRRLNPAIDRDLETICLKCLQKEPAKRYASALALADDLKRYLNHEPILARPASWPERAWRWCRRNPKLAIASGLASLSAAIAMLAIIIGYAQTTRALHKSDHNLQNAMKVVDELFTEVSENELFKRSGLNLVRRSLLAKARDHYQTFLSENADNSSIRRELADAYRRVALIERELDDPLKATESLDNAEKLQRLMLRDQPGDPEVRRSLSDTLSIRGEWYKLARNWEKSIASFEEAARLRDALVKEFPEDHELIRKNANVHMNLGIGFQGKEDWQRAVQEQEAAQKVRQELLKEDQTSDAVVRDSGLGAFNLGLLYLAGDKPDADRAASSLDHAIEKFERLLKSEPTHPQYLYRLLISYRMRASLTDDAEAYYAKAEPVAEQLDRENPETIKYRFEHAALLLDYSGFLADKQMHDEAARRLRSVDELLAPLATEHSEASEHLAKAHEVWAGVAHEQANDTERRAHLQEAVKYYRILSKQLGNAAAEEKAAVEEKIVKLEGLLAAPPKTDTTLHFSKAPSYP